MPHVATAQVVNIPDLRLAAAVRTALNLAPNAPITRQTMQGLTELEVEYIDDLTGLEYAIQLESLSLWNNYIWDLNPLQSLTNLKSLDLTGAAKIQDIRPLQSLTNLKSLDLTGANQIGNFSPLTKLTGLTSLGLFDAGIDDRDLIVIARLTNLTSLGLGFNTITDVSPLAKLTNLTRLSLIYNEIRDISPLAGLTNLTWLAVRENPIQDTSPLAGLTKLVEVDVEITAPSQPISRPTDLISDPHLAASVRIALGLNPGAPITQQALRALTRLDPHLEHFSGGIIVDLTGLEHATGLKTLVLAAHDVTDVTPLARLTNLTWLDLSTNHVTDVTPLAGLTQLTVLQLQYNQIRDVSPLAGLINLENLYLAGNPIQDTSPLAGLTKLVKVDVEITAPSSLPQPIPEDPVQQDSVEVPQSADTQPEPKTPAPSTITAGQITFSELMFATDGGLFSQPQWIELYNNAPIDTEPVNLRGSRLVIEARDREARHRYSALVFEDLHIAPNWTVLLVTRGNKRSSEHLSEGRVYNLYDHSDVTSLGLRENAVLPASGFSLKLFAADGTLVDTAGNLDGAKRSKDAPAWELPPGWTEDRARTSLIRRYEDGTALPGTETMSWVRAADVQLAINTYYGRETDVGTPGYRRGGPLPVVLSFLRSERTDAGVRIQWTTDSETDNAGFNILRSQTKDGAFMRVNPTLIPGAGTTAERNNYTWTDTTAKPDVA